MSSIPCTLLNCSIENNPVHFLAVVQSAIFLDHHGDERQNIYLRDDASSGAEGDIYNVCDVTSICNSISKLLSFIDRAEDCAV